MPGKVVKTMTVPFTCRQGFGDASQNPNGSLNVAFVWPTVAEVRHSIEGWSGGGSLPGTSKNILKSCLTKMMCKWGGEPAGRSMAMPHIKTYVRYRSTCADAPTSSSTATSSSQPAEIAWVLIASHNLSKAAWGLPQKQGSQVRIHPNAT